MAPQSREEYTLGEVTENFDSNRIPARKADREPGQGGGFGNQEPKISCAGKLCVALKTIP